MKKSILKHCILILALTLVKETIAQAENAKDTLSKYAITVAYFGETLTHPGFSVGLERTLLPGAKRDLIGSINLGGYTHPRHHRALFTNIEAGVRRRTKFGLYTDFMLGIGYLHTWANGDVYESIGQGQIKRIRNAGRPHMMTNTTVGAGWDFDVKYATPIKLFVQLKPLFVFHVNHNMLIQSVVTIGASWNF